MGEQMEPDISRYIKDGADFATIAAVRECLELNAQIDTGALVPEPYVRPDESEIQVGDRVYFKYRMPGLSKLPDHPEGWITAPGVVIRVFGGVGQHYYLVRMPRTQYQYPDQIVPQSDIIRVWPWTDDWDR